MEEQTKRGHGPGLWQGKWTGAGSKALVTKGNGENIR